jgi:anti-sigma B factor antagonist
VTVVALVGEVDLTATPAVQAHLDAAAAGDRPRAVVDMTRVTFVDSSFLHALTRAGRVARLAGGRFALAVPDPGLRRMLDVFGAMTDFGIYDDLGQAVAALA